MYADVKAAFGLSAQPAVRVVRKVVDAYATLAAQLKAGLLGGKGSKRYRKATGSPVSFRPEAGQPFDDRCLSWQTDAHTVSIWTMDGRLRGMRYTGELGQLKLLSEHRKGESDLIQQRGKWYLLATCEVLDPEITEPTDWIGVDRGIVNLATTSDGVNYQGRRLSRYRRWQARKRAELQRKNTRSAIRRLARRAQKEQRHATHVNHKISREIVSVAQRTGRGVAVERLDGIRDRVRLRREHRLQGPPERSCLSGGGRAPYLAALPALRAHRKGQQAYLGPLLLSSLRPRWAGRRRRRGQRAQSGTLGVGVCHRTRPCSQMTS
ncbi:transposase [Streptomyces canus]